LLPHARRDRRFLGSGIAFPHPFRGHSVAATSLQGT
jgi:mannitol/fructose-specific phosphotransferase system IIA component